MKNLKKITSILLALALVLGTVGCGNETKTEQTGETVDTESTADTADAADAADTEDTADAADTTVTEDTSGELKKVILATPGPEGKMMESALIAQEEGFFEEELEKVGYYPEYQAFPGAGPAVNEAFASNAIDFAVYGDQPAVTAAANGIGVKIIASTNAYLEHALLIADGVEFNSLADLKGKRIVVGFGTPPHRYVLALLEQNNLSVDDVELINSASDGPTLIGSGDADIVASSQAAILNYEEQGIGKYFETPLSQNILSQIFTLAGRTAFMEENPEAAEAIIKALDRAYEFAQENPEQAYEDLAAGSFSIEVNKTIYPEFSVFDPEITEEMIEHLQVGIDYLKENQIITADISAEDVVDTSYAENALAE